MVGPGKHYQKIVNRQSHLDSPLGWMLVEKEETEDNLKSSGLGD